MGKKSSFLKERVTSHYEKDFLLVLQDNFSEMSRFDAVSALNREMGTDFKPSNLWNAAQSVGFSFSGRKKGKTKKNELGVSVSTKNSVIPNHNINTIVNYECCECEFKTKSRLDNPDLRILALKARKCPKCDSYGTFIATYSMNGSTYRKACVPIPGTDIFREEFVDEDLNSVDKSYFEEKTDVEDEVPVESPLTEPTESSENEKTAEDKTTFLI